MALIRLLLRLAIHTLYRIRVLGRAHVPDRGPALIVCNHMSLIDGFLVGASVRRQVRFLVWGVYFRSRVVRWMLHRVHAIPISAGRREDILTAIARARQELADGHVVCIFAEGAISRTGNLLPLKRGFERIVNGLDVPIVPAYLDRVWGSIFSFKRGRFLWKLPERFPYPVTVAFGGPLPATSPAETVRHAILELGADAVEQRRTSDDRLQTAFMRVARRRWGRPAIADSTGRALTYGRTLVGALALARLLKRQTPGEDTIGVLLPSTVGGALANIAVLAAGRVPVNLNFTIGSEAMSASIAKANIRTIVTSKTFLTKASLEERPGMVFLEDLAKAIGGAAKLRALVEARLAPMALLRRWYGGRRDGAYASLATIVFSSGSTGVPKGVMLTHANVLSNIDSLKQIFPIALDDCFVGVLPFFHSFGFTGTLWFPLLVGCRAVYHPNPLDAKTIGELAETHRGTMLISTPTFCQSYIRRCTKQQFAHLKYAIVGAEKLRRPIAEAFEQQFGIGLLEGYGCTEMSPVVAVNRPDVGLGREKQIGAKAGSVGHPIPGVAAKIVDRETGEGPLYDREGLLLVRGPNLMAGYLDDPEQTAQVVRDGWYVTGDIATMDADGFIYITDRLSRFSKIGGEMVPHVRIEDAANAVLGEACAAVTAIADASRGERLVLFHTRADVSAADLADRLSQTDLPRLWLPRREAILYIEAIPTLGTGKTDLRQLRALAEARMAALEPAARG